MISIQLMDYMGSDLTTINAARATHEASSDTVEEREKGLLKMLATEHHVTPFRHAHIQIRCTAPIFLARQLGKHQVGFSWNETSRRYKDDKAIPVECYVPDLILARPEKLMSQSAQPMDADFAQDAQHIIHQANQSALRQYQLLLEVGVAPEQARGVLPQNMYTTWVWTGSLYGFFMLWKQRSSSHAQYEARIFAEQIAELASTLFPETWAALVRATEREELAMKLLKEYESK